LQAATDPENPDNRPGSSQPLRGPKLKKIRIRKISEEMQFAKTKRILYKLKL
jgi:hypothetical protein